MKRILILTFAAMLALSVAIGGTNIPVQTQVNDNDTVIIRTDTLKEIEVKGKKELPVVDAIRQSLGSDMVQPKQKSVSDVLGKASDYILHPFARKQRQRAKKLKNTKQVLERLDAAKTYEDELTEAIRKQLYEDSIAALRKK